MTITSKYQPARSRALWATIAVPIPIPSVSDKIMIIGSLYITIEVMLLVALQELVPVQ